MFSYEVACPHCGKTFSYSLLKFKSRYICEQCEHRILVDTKLMPILIQAFIFITFSQIYIMVLPKMGIENSFFTYVILFFLLYAWMIILVEIMVRLLGFHKIFRVSMFDAVGKQVSK